MKTEKLYFHVLSGSNRKRGYLWARIQSALLDGNGPLIVRHNFELNAFKPVILYNNLQSINLLSDSIDSFINNCLKNIKPNTDRINKHLRNSLMLVTALNNYIGYDNASKIAKKAHKENLTLKEAALKLKLIDGDKFDEIVDPKKMI